MIPREDVRRAASKRICKHIRMKGCLVTVKRSVLFIAPEEERNHDRRAVRRGAAMAGQFGLHHCRGGGIVSHGLVEARLAPAIAVSSMLGARI